LMHMALLLFGGNLRPVTYLYSTFGEQRFSRHLPLGKTRECVSA